MRKAFPDDVGSAESATRTTLVAKVPTFRSGFTSGGDVGKYYKATCSSFNTDHLPWSQSWLKTRFYNRENEWPWLIWSVGICSGKANRGWPEASVPADSVAADVFPISVSKRETSSSCANERAICYECQHFVNYFTVLPVSSLYLLASAKTNILDGEISSARPRCAVEMYSKRMEEQSLLLPPALGSARKNLMVKMSRTGWEKSGEKVNMLWFRRKSWY